MIESEILINNLFIYYVCSLNQHVFKIVDESRVGSTVLTY